MLTKLLAWTDGKKTYLFILAYGLYRLAVTHGWTQPSIDLETLLLTGAGLSVRNAISKASK